MIVQAIYKWLLPVQMRKLESVRGQGEIVIVKGIGKGQRRRFWLDNPLDKYTATVDKPWKQTARL